MKSFTTIATFAVLACSTSANAQCEKTAVFTSAQTVYLDSADNVVRTEDEVSTIAISKTELTIKPGNNNIMKGPVSDYTCNWTTPFKDGKTVLKASLNNGDGESRGVTLTIEGKKGVITFLATIDDDPNKKIKLVATKFE